MKLDEKILSEELMHKGNFLKFVNVTVELPDGKKGTRDIIRHPGASAILPFIDDVDYAMDKLREEREELSESGYGSFELGGTDNVQQDNKQTSNFNE